jgi:hypothetical protein
MTWLYKLVVEQFVTAHITGEGDRLSRPLPYQGAREGGGRPAGDDRVRWVAWADAGPVMTAVVRCDLVVRGPDVAPVWPGHELGRRVRALPQRRMLRQWRRSGRPAIVRC